MFIKSLCRTGSVVAMASSMVWLVGCGDNHLSRDTSNIQKNSVGTQGQNLIQSRSAWPVAATKATRKLSPAATSQGLTQLTDGNALFALNVYKSRAADIASTDNMVFSPHSISSAVAMLALGARNNTATQIQQALQFNLPSPVLHETFNALDLALSSRAIKANDPEFALDIANSLWAQDGYPLLNGFVDAAMTNYGANINLLDFQSQADPSRLAINEYVSEKTHQRVNDLIPEGIVNEQTRVVLTNSIYFNAHWQTPFVARKTIPGDFFRLDGSTSPADYMTDKRHANYVAGSGFQAMELPYRGEELSMVFVLADEGNFRNLEQGLSVEAIRNIENSLSNSYLNIRIPRFEISANLPIGETLQAFGMSDAFANERADFSGIANPAAGDKLYLQALLHKATIIVDEKGTEAAAATAAVAGAGGGPEPILVELNRPFLFYIRDRPTGSILFIGRVASTGR